MEDGKKLRDVIYAHLQEPSDWICGQHKVCNTKYNYCLWVANGCFYLNGDSNFNKYKIVPHLKLLDRIILWPHVKKMIENVFIYNVDVKD